jgi:hypothetical protein
MKRALWLLGLGALASGCSLVGNATHNVVLETRQYLDTRAEEARNRRWADTAWEEVRQSGHPESPSDDYADGFKAGFADYLFAGGTGEPPPLPPHRYWTQRYQTPAGDAAIQDWFAGFRHGAATARDGGFRRWVTLSPPRPPPLGPAVVPEPAVLPPPTPIAARPLPPRPPEPVAPGPEVELTSVWPVHGNLSFEPVEPALHGVVDRPPQVAVHGNLSFEPVEPSATDVSRRATKQACSANGPGGRGEESPPDPGRGSKP